jgi:hypothetical protein
MVAATFLISFRRKTQSLKDDSSFLTETPLKKTLLEALTKRIRPFWMELLRLENLPFFVLTILAASSLISRLWLMWH